jgi:hypothetical protein
VEEKMKKDAESLFKKGLRSVAASVPVAASLSQWWAEMDSDIQTEAIEKLQSEVHQLKNPILTCHSMAVEALKVLYSRIESTGDTRWTVALAGEHRRTLSGRKFLFDQPDLLRGNRPEFVQIAAKIPNAQG